MKEEFLQRNFSKSSREGGTHFSREESVVNQT
jgi:hypothetical protein